ncbi:MAG: creatininase family protein, partial [Gemmataceae bacterium]
LGRVSREGTVVITPIAACEQHSRHLPTFTDTILVTAVAEGVEQQLPREVLLLPTLWLGASHHHLPWGGTLSLDVDMHTSILCDLLAPLLEEGYRRVMFLNGHGGNIDTLKSALRKLQPIYPDNILAGASYWELAETELAELGTGPRNTMGHACEYETSMILALRPELVRRDQIKDDEPVATPPALRGLYISEDFKQRTDHGAVGYPEKANAENGRKMLDVAIGRTTEAVRALLERKLP